MSIPSITAKIMLRIWVLFSFFIIASCHGPKGPKVRQNGSEPEILDLNIYSQPQMLSNPTIYYLPVVDMTQTMNQGSYAFISVKGQTLSEVSQSVYEHCLMQGSCLLKNGGQIKLINVDGYKDGMARFRIADRNKCPYSFGANGACVDPFYSVAADLKNHFSPGDVIYVPFLKGTKLPDGTEHNGYLIVRDSGGRIEGPSRFDFFTGFFHHRDPHNPFQKVNKPRLKLYFYKVINPQVIQQVQISRNYPRLNVDVMETGLRSNSDASQASIQFNILMSLVDGL